MTPRWRSQFFLTLLKDKYQLSGCQNLFSSLFLQDFQPNLVKLVQDLFVQISLCQLLQKMFAAFLFSGKQWLHQHLTLPTARTYQIFLRLLIWHFQADDSYTHPTQNWFKLNSLKAVHKRAVWWSRRKALQGSMSVQVARNEIKADSARRRSVNDLPQLQR